MDYFDELGDHIEEAWAARNRDEEALPDIACEALTRFPPPPNLPDSIAADLLDADRELTTQLAPAGAFGEPGVTLYYGDGFVVDVYFWNNAVPAIHNHPFCGCFTILRGRSLHDVYSFELGERLGTGVTIGELKAERLTLLEAGSVIPFSLIRYPLIHSLVHVTNPAVSMVIRSIRTVEYYRYFPPHMALAMDASDNRLSRQLQMFGWLRSAGDPGYVDRLHEFLRHANFETSVRLISAVFDPDINDELVDVIRERHGDHADLILPSLAEAIRLQTENDFRQQFSSDETRMVLSIFMCAHDRADVFRLLGEAWTDDDATMLLDRLDVFDEEDEVVRAAYAQLVRGEFEADDWRDTIFRALTIGN